MLNLGNCLELIKDILDNSIDLCKDSPTSVSGGGIAKHIK